MKTPSLIIPSLIAVLSLAGCEKKPDAKPAASKAAPVAQVTEAQWCAEHGVPESICTRCNSSLIADFKQKGDWCKDHNLPKSQCITCDPTLKDKFAAMAPKK